MDAATDATSTVSCDDTKMILLQLVVLLLQARGREYRKHHPQFSTSNGDWSHY